MTGIKMLSKQRFWSLKENSNCSQNGVNRSSVRGGRGGGGILTSCFFIAFSFQVRPGLYFSSAPKNIQMVLSLDVKDQ